MVYLKWIIFAIAGWSLSNLFAYYAQKVNFQLVCVDGTYSSHGDACIISMDKSITLGIVAALFGFSISYLLTKLVEKSIKIHKERK